MRLLSCISPLCLTLTLALSLTAPLPALAATPAPDPLLQAPQDLHFFAQQAGEDMVLLSPEEQAQRNARSDTLFFGPWKQAKPSVSSKQFSHRIIRKARGFLWDKPWTAEAWAKMVSNANAGRYPQAQGPGIVTAHADLRALPTAEPLFLEPTATPAVDFFDFFQHASLATGTPVYVSHVSADGQWFYVEYPLLSGWLKADSVALVSREFIKDYSKRKLAAVVREGLPLTTVDGQDLGKSYVGAVFPLADAPGEILVPRREKDGSARLARVAPPEGSTQPKPLPLTPGNMARLGSQMLGQTYAWGGKGTGRDCSLMTRDLFLPFGIWLPRNSRHQAGAKDNAKLGKMSPEAKKVRVLREGRPFMTLLGFPGHVGLYVGTYKGEPVMLHNILGLRTHNREEWYRHLIAKGILSTLEPGAHMPELQLSETLLERLSGLRVLP